MELFFLLNLIVLLLNNICIEIYKKYENERSVVANGHIRLLNLYVDNYKNLTNDQAAYWSKDVIKLQQKEVNLKKKYIKK